MTFNILGTAEKRPIVYPLLYALNLLGSALLVTDDGAYRRLLQDEVCPGSIGNTSVFIGADTGAEFLIKNGIDPDEYEHVVYAVPTQSGVSGYTIRVKQNASPFGGTSAHDTSDGEIPPSNIIYTGFEAPKEKGALFIPITESTLKEIFAVENLHRFNPVKDAKLLNTLAALFAPAFNRDVKAMKKLLRYKGGKLT